MSEDDLFQKLTHLARHAPAATESRSAPPGFADAVVERLALSRTLSASPLREAKAWERLAFPGAMVAAAVALFAVFCVPEQTEGAPASDPVAAMLAECIVVEALLE